MNNDNTHYVEEDSIEGDYMSLDEIVLSDIEPYFFGDEKVIERIIKGTANTTSLKDLMV